MANKRFKSTIATISVAGYIETKKITNTINWRVCCIDEKNVDKLLADEERKILASIKECYQSTKMDLKVKTTVENHYFDTFLSVDVRKLGDSGVSEKTLKQL